MKKIAIVHDYIKEYGGAERVLEVLHEMYPDAPIYTLLYAPNFLGPHKERFLNFKIRQSFLGFIPFSYKFISWYRLIAPLVFRTFDFSGFDLVIISATGAYNPNIINKENAKLICYCHTPPRYLYGYATARDFYKNPLAKILLALMKHVLRMVDFVSSKNVDIFIANSENVKHRIEKFYRRNAVVVYPPVETKKIHESGFKIQEKKYYLTGGRLASPKHVDLIVKACTELNVPLKIFGKSFAGYGEKLKSAAGKNVEFLGEVSDSSKIELMRGAKAFLFASEDEDFGIVPVEAMGCGTPVIAYRSGGVMESVIEGKTGIFFDELNVKAVMDAINKFNKMKIKPENCIRQAEKFSKKRFLKGMERIIKNA